eukprot:COSAG01_NODE_10665_length_2109_cov_1.913433_3_plen_53_part_00
MMMLSGDDARSSPGPGPGPGLDPNPPPPVVRLDALGNRVSGLVARRGSLSLD